MQAFIKQRRGHNRLRSTLANEVEQGETKKYSIDRRESVDGELSPEGETNGGIHKQEIV